MNKITTRLTGSKLKKIDAFCRCHSARSIPHHNTLNLQILTHDDIKIGPRLHHRSHRGSCRSLSRAGLTQFLNLFSFFAWYKIWHSIFMPGDSKWRHFWQKIWQLLQWAGRVIMTINNLLWKINKFCHHSRCVVTGASSWLGTLGWNAEMGFGPDPSPYALSLVIVIIIINVNVITGIIVIIRPLPVYTLLGEIVFLIIITIVILFIVNITFTRCLPPYWDPS